MFLDAGHEDFHLGAGSPCINAGYTMETDGVDLDGFWRVCGDRIDIGAYEYSATGVSETVQNESLIHIVGNPITASSYAEMELENAGVLFAKVYSTEGKLLVNKGLGETQVGTNRFAIGEMFAPLSSGTYLLVFQVSDKTFVAKVVK